MASGGADNVAALDTVPPDTASTDEDACSSDTSSAFDPSSQVAPAPAHPPRQIALEDTASEAVKLTLDGFTLDEATLVNSPMLPYLAMVAAVIEGYTISSEGLLHSLRQSMRQRSFDRLPRREYVLRVVDQHPP
jgi:hypothetical protein